jgi:hypothetical protein
MNKEQALEWLECADSEAHFINDHVKIKDPLHGIIPFTLHPYQVDTLNKFEDYRKCTILKARQMGLSWLVCAHALWVALFGGAKLILIISKRETDAYYLMERIQFMYDKLPSWLRMEVTERNKGVLAFSNDSKIESQPTTKDAGRSRIPSLLVIDEHAFCRYDTELMNSAETALAQGGKCVILSTANGYGNEFARIWFGAKRGENTYHPIFLPWYIYPGRNAEWLANETKGWQTWRIGQEYPGTWEEAFRQTGRPVFDYDSLAQTASCLDPFDLSDDATVWELLGLKDVSIAPAFARGEDEDADQGSYIAEHRVLQYRTELSIFQKPDAEACYLIGADVAEGLAHGDNSAVTIIDRETGEEVACWYGKLKPHDFAALLHELAQIYPGLLLPERNNHGQTVLTLLEAWNTPHLYWSKPVWDRNSGKKIRDRKSGWETTGANKTLIIDEIAMALKLGWYRPANPMFIKEAEKYETQDTGKYSAPEGYTDDLVMSTAIGWQGRKYLVVFEGLSSGKRRESMKED